MKIPVWTKWLAIFFLALALVLIGATFWPRRQDAVSSRLDLRPNFSIIREFRVPKKAEYRIEIRCSRSMPFEQLKKHLRDGNLVDVKLLQDGAPVEMHYFPNPPFVPGVISTLNDSGNLGFAQDWISQDIADFTGDPKNLYKITCTVIRPLEQLNTTRPTLFVTLDPLELVSGTVESVVVLAAALLSVLLSLIFAAVFYFLLRRARSRVAWGGLTNR